MNIEENKIKRLIDKDASAIRVSYYLYVYHIDIIIENRN